MNRSIPIPGSAFDRLAALLWLCLAVLLGIGFFEIARGAVTGLHGGSRVLAVAGLCLTLPLAVHVMHLLADLAWRLVRPRKARIDVSDDVLTIHDSWFLTRPMVFHRDEIRSIEAVEKPRFWQMTAFSRPDHDLATALSMEWGRTFTTQLVLHDRRRFIEAIRTPPAINPLPHVARNRVALGLLLRVDNSNDRVWLQAWVQPAPPKWRIRPSNKRTRPRTKTRISQRDNTRLLLALPAAVGFVLLVLGGFGRL